jgi:hypothetical protein
MTSPFARMAAGICFGPGAMTRLDRGACPDCGEEKPIRTLTTEIELREFHISGLCKACQDKVFGDHR